LVEKMRVHTLTILFVFSALPAMAKEIAPARIPAAEMAVISSDTFNGVQLGRYEAAISGCGGYIANEELYNATLREYENSISGFSALGKSRAMHLRAAGYEASSGNIHYDTVGFDWCAMMAEDGILMRP
jgi:hypothetical protein